MSEPLGDSHGDIQGHDQIQDTNHILSDPEWAALVPDDANADNLLDLNNYKLDDESIWPAQPSHGYYDQIENPMQLSDPNVVFQQQATVPFHQKSQNFMYDDSFDEDQIQHPSNIQRSQGPSGGPEWTGPEDGYGNLESDGFGLQPIPNSIEPPINLHPSFPSLAPDLSGSGNAVSSGIGLNGATQGAPVYGQTQPWNNRMLSVAHNSSVASTSNSPAVVQNNFQQNNTQQTTQAPIGLIPNTYNFVFRNVPAYEYAMPVGPPLNFTMAEILTFLPHWAKIPDIAIRFLNNGIDYMIHRNILMAHRDTNRMDVTTRSIGYLYLSTMRPRGFGRKQQAKNREKKALIEKWDQIKNAGGDPGPWPIAYDPNEEVMWTFDGHAKPASWSDRLITVNEITPNWQNQGQANSLNDSVPLRSLTAGVKKMPAGPDTADLTRAVEFAVNNPGAMYLFPDDLHTVLGQIGYTQITDAHTDPATVQRYATGTTAPRRVHIADTLPLLTQTVNHSDAVLIDLDQQNLINMGTGGHGTQVAPNFQRPLDNDDVNFQQPPVTENLNFLQPPQDEDYVEFAEIARRLTEWNRQN
jgi:hypothetical protein